MTKQEMLKKYNIPAELLDKYEKIKKCTVYTDKDIENISMIMTLYDAGFDNDEVKKYIGLCLCGEDTAFQRSAMLAEKRKSTLDAIHLKQKQLNGIDYLRYTIMREKDKF